MQEGVLGRSEVLKYLGNFGEGLDVTTMRKARGFSELHYLEGMRCDAMRIRATGIPCTRLMAVREERV